MRKSPSKQQGNVCFDGFEILQPYEAASKEIKERRSLAALRIQSKAKLRRFCVPVRVSTVVNANTPYVWQLPELGQLVNNHE